MPSNLERRIAALEELHRRKQGVGSNMFNAVRNVEDPLSRASIWSEALSRLTDIECLILDDLFALREEYPTLSGADLWRLLTPIQHALEREFYRLCRSVIRERAGEIEEDPTLAEEIRKRAVEDFENTSPLWLVKLERS